MSNPTKPIPQVTIPEEEFQKFRAGETEYRIQIPGEHQKGDRVEWSGGGESGRAIIVSELEPRNGYTFVHLKFASTFFVHPDAA